MNTRQNRSLKRLSSAAVALVLGTSGSSAMALVTEWTFSTSAFFVDGSATFSSGGGTTLQSGASTTPEDDSFELSWGTTGGGYLPGTAENRSALTIGTPTEKTGGGAVTGSVSTVIGGTPDPATDFGLGVSITHWNNVLGGTLATLTGGVIRDTLTLTPFDPLGGPSQDAPPIDFEFSFAETANSAPCSLTADDTQPGGPVCPDLFGIAEPLETTINIGFEYDSVPYLLSVLVFNEATGAAPFEILGDEECDEFTPDLPSGCGGFRTAEGAATTVQFAFAISTEKIFVDVPAPAPLSLLGLGLLGLGAARRGVRKS
jgi:hypothetical protein